MNKNELYLADPSAENPTYIYFEMLVFTPFDVSIMLKVGDNEYIDTGRTIFVWKWTKKVMPISTVDPPLLDNTPYSRQLFVNNGEEIYNLYQEAMMQDAFEQIELDVIGIKLYDFRKAHNIRNTESKPYNRWVVYTGNNLPDHYQVIIEKFFTDVER